MDDIISRQAAIEKTDMLFKELSKDYVDMMGIGYNHAVADAIATLKCLPSAERHGRWQKDEQHTFICSVCGCEAYGDAFGEQKLSTYCPNCAARMDEVGE